MSDRPNLSIMMVTYGQLDHTIRGVDAVFKNTENFELIIVDNGSKDGTVAWLNHLRVQHSDCVKIILNKENRNFAGANNQALEIAKGKYTVALNNDTMVSPHWAERLQDHLDNAPIPNLKFVGPVCNSSNGRQQVPRGGYMTIDQLGAYSEQWYKDHKGHMSETGILYGWCIFGRTETWKELKGFDASYRNAYDDNDLCLRAMLKGYRMSIAIDTYIHHHGQGTLGSLMNVEGYMKIGNEEREKFFKKWYPQRDPKLIVIMRLANCSETLGRALEQACKIGDEIIVHLCRNSDDEVMRLVQACPKIVPECIGVYDGPFQEDYERGWLHDKAVERGAEWILSIDGDEVYEDRFVRQAKALTKPRNPHIMGYVGSWRTLWDSENMYRSDGIFGGFQNCRFYRVLPGYGIASEHPEGHHCGSSPIMPSECVNWHGIRVLHLGYETLEQRKRKFNFYSENDNFKNPRDIGTSDYGHLLDINVERLNYDADAAISLVMMAWAFDEDILCNTLERIEPIVDEIVIVDTGLTLEGIKALQRFGMRSPANLKIVKYTGRLEGMPERLDHYARARNLGKRCATKSWILTLDPDEAFEPKDLGLLLRALDREEDAFMFHVCNYVEQPIAGQEAKYKSTITYRLFRNWDRIFWANPVHETIDDAILALQQTKKISTGQCPVALHHHGYLRGHKKVKPKMDHYEALNDHWRTICGDADPRPFYNQAMHCLHDVIKGGATDRMKGLGLLQQSLKTSPLFFYSNFEMCQQNMITAKFYIEQCIGGVPEDHPFRPKALEVFKQLDDMVVDQVQVPLGGM